MQHRIVFVVGLSRTGTSILVKCLENSGYNIGKRAFGHKYKSQDGVFGYANNEIFSSLKDQLKGRVVDINKPIEVTEDIAKLVRSVFQYAQLYKVDVLKNPWFHNLIGIYAAVNAEFFDHKFIWTHRDPLERAKSEVRLKYMRSVPPGNSFKNYKVKKLMRWDYEYQDVHSLYFNKRNGINVYFEDLLNDTQSVSRKLSNFLGREFDSSTISKHETFKATGVPQ